MSDKESVVILPLRIVDCLDPNTLLMRYMSLPTFLLLLGGRAFIPTLWKLRENDQLESNVPKNVLPEYWRICEAMLAPVENYLIKLGEIGGGYIRRNSAEVPHNQQTMGFLIEMWLGELSRRRCVWCWNKEDDESHALWRLYGNRGIAVISSVKRIRESMRLPDRTNCSVSSVLYVPTSVNEQRHADIYPKLVGDIYLPRPYYFKEIGYKYEHEVRFAFAVEPKFIGVAPGVLVELDPRVLIQNIDDIRISPHLLGDEAKVIRKLIESALAGSGSIDLSPPPASRIDVFDGEGMLATAAPQSFRDLLLAV